jgi:hypothetical protein
MKTHCLDSIDTRPIGWDRVRAGRAEQDRAVRRSEAVLRILKDRSTLVEEAVRMEVDVETVAGWLATTLVAIGRALAEAPTLRDAVDAMPRRRRQAC